MGLLVYEPGADPPVVEARLTRAGWSFLERSHPQVPGAVGNLVSTSSLAMWLAVYFLVLGTIVTGLAAVRRDPRRSHERCVLRALGFTSGDVRRSVVAESVTVVVIGCAAGIIGGLAVGRTAWRLMTDSLGIVNPQSSPLVVIAGVVALSIICGLAVSVVDMRRTGRAVSATMLYEE
jgi:putative ABC transport system permease protein